MSDTPEPPRKFYELKPREFERVNSAPREVSEPAARAGSPAALDQSQPIDVRDLIRQGVPSGPLRSAHAPANRENEVHAMLRENLARADAAGLNVVAPPQHTFRRRKRDYWMLMVIGNLFIAVIYVVELLLGFQVQCLAAKMPGEFANLVRYAVHNPAVWVLAPVGMLFFSGCLTWLMFGVMDDY